MQYNENSTIRCNSSQQLWVGYDHQSDELILQSHCPFDYCVNDTVVFLLTNTDSQCAYNRSGLLCGACKKNYSLALGSSQCKQCTNSHLALLIPIGLMGVALVFLVLVTRLTMATGTLSGLMSMLTLLELIVPSFYQWIPLMLFQSSLRG